MLLRNRDTLRPNFWMRMSANTWRYLQTEGEVGGGCRVKSVAWLCRQKIVRHSCPSKCLKVAIKAKSVNSTALGYTTPCALLEIDWWSLRCSGIGPTGYTETPVNNYRYTLRNRHRRVKASTAQRQRLEILQIYWYYISVWYPSPSGYCCAMLRIL
jgi:hypothetical protein